MKISAVSERKVVIWVIVAAVCGIMLGSRERIAALWQDEPGGRPVVQDRTLEPPSTDFPTRASATGTTRNASEPGATNVQLGKNQLDGVIRAAGGLALKASYRSNAFVGYEVIDSGLSYDLPVGVIIVAVNGVPVEESAAGSEILIASLADGLAELTVLPKSNDN